VSALERLDAIDARTHGASPGTWRVHVANEGVHGESDAAFVVFDDSAGMFSVLALSNWGTHRDARFAAASRQDVPVMATALRAILNLHTPEQHRGHECCLGCEQRYPCSTVRIIEAELAR
jgi:hypothetical protein